MTTVCVVQARMGSSRLPGKVVADLGGGFRVLGLLLERLRPAPVDTIVVATTAAARDDVVEELARSIGVAVVRGPEEDVLGRFALVLDAFPADQVVRITADCPLVDPSVVASVLATHAATRADYTSNTLIRTYPDGLDVEVVAASALRAADQEAVDADEREHVTPFVYRRPERFVLAASVGPRQLAHERWTLDTAEDLARLRQVVSTLADPHLGWEQIVEGRPGPPLPLPVLRPATAADRELVGAPVDDPGSRVWVLADGAQPPLWARVDVRTGVGRLELGGGPTGGRPTSGGRAERLLALLQGVLAQDLQVTRLRAGPDAGSGTAFAAAGFVAAEGSAEVVWRPPSRRRIGMDT